jgi:XTP/dITP diphosphohydrolase
MDLVIATKHWHKIREIKQILKPLTFLDLYSLHDFPDCAIEECLVDSLEETALNIASHCACQTQKWVLADCSKLVIPALQQVLSEDSFDTERILPAVRKKILADMAFPAAKNRSSYLECYMVLAGPLGVKKQARAVCEGMLADKELGNGGHSYDSLFIKNNYDKTLAQLGDDVKNKVSHRRKALDNIVLALETLSR